MCETFNLITTDNITKAMNNYNRGEEKNTTTNYFKYDNLVYPVMRIIKNAIILNQNIDDENMYQNINCCKYILEERFPNKITFLGTI